MGLDLYHILAGICTGRLHEHDKGFIEILVRYRVDDIPKNEPPLFRRHDPRRPGAKNLLPDLKSPISGDPDNADTSDARRRGYGGYGAHQ